MNPTADSARPARVLIVDDDEELAGLMRDYLARAGFLVTCVHDGRSGITEALTGLHDIVVLDVMLPGCDGFDVLGAIRSRSAVPVLMLTARGDDGDRVAGLEHGADDYVPKPCSPRELAARLRSILKRVRAPAPPATGEGAPIVIGTLMVWPALRQVTDESGKVELTSTEFSVLEILARHAGRVVSKEEISATALGRPLTRFDRSIDVHIHSIRSKLRPLPDGRSRIQTVIRRGYQMIPE